MVRQHRFPWPVCYLNFKLEPRISVVPVLSPWILLDKKSPVLLHQHICHIFSCISAVYYCTLNSPMFLFFRPEGVLWCLQAFMLQISLFPGLVQARGLPGGSPGLWDRWWGFTELGEWSGAAANRKHAAKPHQIRLRDFWWWFLDWAVEKWRWTGHVQCLPWPVPVGWWKHVTIQVSVWHCSLRRFHGREGCQALL